MKKLSTGKTLLFASCLILAIVSVVACSKNDSDPSDTDTDSNAVANLPPVADSKDTDADGDVFVFTPVESDVTESPPIVVSAEELENSLMQITQDLGEDQLEKYYFLCDSVIYGMKSLGMLSDGRNTDKVITGISSSFSLSSGKNALVYLSKNDEIVSAADAVRALCPEYLLVSVGTDELLKRSDMSESDFYNCYRELISSLREASQSTIIVCMPILPGSDGDDLNIYEAENFNKYIHAAAAEFGAYYIDIASAFSNSSGYLRIDCDAGSSCLNTTGLKRLLELLRTYKIPEIIDASGT